MDSLPLSRVVNSQPAGIGRIASYDGRCAWNNLGRNVVFADSSLRPLAVFGDTLFPADDEPSQFDLDVHAIIELAGSGQIAVVNHLGSVRIFEPPRSRAPHLVLRPDLDEARRLEFIDDIERVTRLGDHLVTSRPRGRRLGGVLVTQPIATSRQYLDAEVAQQSFGFVTALEASSTPSGTGWVALGGEGRVRLVEAERGALGGTRWEAAVDFLPAVLAASGSSLWAAGSSMSGVALDDYDWDQLGGGGLAQLDLDSGAVLASARFGDDLAWGSGGVALAVVGGVPCGVGRRGEVHALPPGATVTSRLTGELADDPLGIAHAAVVGDQFVFGFNRGGYELYAYPLNSISRLVRDLPDHRA
ncbi:MAG: hypothetical protein ACRDYE_08320 [Acidimicrobiales bacterium]